jgi:SPP1 family predicted phage head-tail adaptor
MRAGKLDRQIKIQSVSNTVDDYGTPVVTWTDFATVRAELVDPAIQEPARDYGETPNFTATFRIRWLADVTSLHRVQFEGRNLNIREVREIGRRRGLELRCEEVRP